jgi:hypothetical protein
MPPDDLALLPADLAARSRSTQEIALAGDDALHAVEHLARAGRRIETWEGWVWFPDGGRTRSLAHPGPFALPMDPERAAAVARDGMAQAAAAWARSPEYPGATLTFYLVVAPR